MSNLKPFNLERALAGAIVTTEAGDKVLDIKHFKKMPEPHNISVQFEGCPELCWFDLDGDPKDPNSLSLKMAPEIRTVWLNIYKSDITEMSTGPFDSEQDANDHHRGWWTHERRDSHGSRIGNKPHPLTIEE